MKKTITTGNIGYAFEQVIENEIECGRKWAEMGWFDEDRFEDGHYYYFSNYYGSEGGYYNEDTDELITSDELDEMEPEEREEFENKCWEFVEYPIDRELSGLHVEYDTNFKSDYFNEKYGEEVIKAEDGKNYKDGSGVYQYNRGLFYQVELVDKD